MHFANSILEAVYIKNIKENCSIFVFINLPICCFRWSTGKRKQRSDIYTKKAHILPSMCQKEKLGLRRWTELPRNRGKTSCLSINKKKGFEKCFFFLPSDVWCSPYHWNYCAGPFCHSANRGGIPTPPWRWQVCILHYVRGIQRRCKSYWFVIAHRLFSFFLAVDTFLTGRTVLVESSPLFWLVRYPPLDL